MAYSCMSSVTGLNSSDPSFASDLCIPPSYSEVTVQHASLSGRLTFVDFVPTCEQEGNLFILGNPEFQQFTVLIDRANDWLKQNPSWETKTCESVEFKTTRTKVHYHELLYFEHGSSFTSYVRGLRLWIVPRTDSSRLPQQIAYVNLVPAIHNNMYESLDQMLKKFNEHLERNPLPGKVITVETRQMPVRKGTKCNPDISFWRECGDFDTHFIFVVRVFYELTMPAYELIGFRDFLPQPSKTKGLENFSQVIDEAFQWCSKQSGVRFCNAQSLEIKIKSDGNINSLRGSYTEHGFHSTCFIRILRVIYTKFLPRPDSFMSSHTPVLALTCKTFRPVQVSRSWFDVQYEPLSDVRKRIQDWVCETNARVLSAETSKMCLYAGRKKDRNRESSYIYKAGKGNTHWFFVFRLYLDGFYPDPRPFQPLTSANSCCILL